MSAAPPRPECRFQPFEFRAAADPDGSPGILSGIAMPYGARAEIAPGLFERFEPGAFEWDEADGVLLNWQHDRGVPLARTGPGGVMVLQDSREALRLTAELPPTQGGRDVAELARRGVLRGFSIEFRAIRDSVVDGTRVVRQARLAAVSVVDRPAYGDAVAELRARLEGGGVPLPRRRPIWQ